MVFLKTNKHAWHHMPIEVYLHLQWQHQVQPTLQNQVPLHPRVVKRRPAWQKAQIVLSWGFGFRNIFFLHWTELISGCFEALWDQIRGLCIIWPVSLQNTYFSLSTTCLRQMWCSSSITSRPVGYGKPKKDKEPRSYHGRWQHFLFFCKGSLLQGSCVEWPAFKYPWARIGPKHRL